MRLGNEVMHIFKNIISPAETDSLGAKSKGRSYKTTQKTTKMIYANKQVNTQFVRCKKCYGEK